MRSSTALALAAWLAGGTPAAAGTAPAPHGELIERILAVIDGRPLLLSDVRTLQLIRGLSEAKALEAAIDQRLMYVEAARLPQAEVLPEEEERALKALRETQPSRAAQVTDADLRRLMAHQIAILKYVEFRFQPQVRVSDADVRKAWEDEQAGRPAGPALEDEAQEIRKRLEQRALDERIEAWVTELRARADVRYVPPEPPAGGP
jgi:hypothetical protein